MSIIAILLISSAGVNSLLMPVSSKGVVTCYSRSEGDEAIFYNPANFESTDDFKLICFYNNLYVAMKSFSLALSKKIKSVDFGISIMNYDYGEIEARPDYPSEDSTINYSANDFSFGLCGSSKISPQGRFGLNLKYISENIFVYSGYTFAFDISIAYRSNIGGISFGATNIGSTITINNEEVNLPAKLSIGFYRHIKKITTSFDLHYLINIGKFEFSIGGETPVGRFVELGLAVNYREYFYPGFNLTVNSGSFSVKYGTAIYPYNLGMINTLGIGFKF